MEYKNGKPGIGVTGLLGIKGFNGLSIYIGKLNSSKFFDYITQEMLDEYNLSDLDISFSIGEKRLHPKYKEGDTIFVLNDSSNIVKRIELTKNHVLCKEDYLYNTYGESYPLSILYFDIENDNLIHFPLNLVYSDIQHINDTSKLYVANDKYGTALINGKYINSAENVQKDYNIDISVPYYEYIPEKYDASSIYINNINNGYEIYNNVIKNSEEVISYIKLLSLKSDDSVFNVETDQKGLYLKTSTSKLKINNLYIKNTNKGNVEAIDTVFNKDILLDTDGNCYTLNINDYNANTLKFTLDKSKFFTNSDVNMDNYHFGYIHTMYNCLEDSSYYHPNYITDEFISDFPFNLINKLKGDEYERAWDNSMYKSIQDETVKEVLANATTELTLYDVSKNLPKNFNMSIYEKYKDFKGIIKISSVTQPVKWVLKKDLDGNVFYLYNDILSSDIIDESKNVYESNIVNLIDPSILNIDLTITDSSAILYMHHDIVLWILVPEGIKYYSKHTKAVYDSYNNTYNIITGNQIYKNANTVINDISNNVFEYIIDDSILKVIDTNSIVNGNIIVYVNGNNKPVEDNCIDISDVLLKNTEFDVYIMNTSILDDLYNDSIHKVNSYLVPVMVEYKTYESDTSLYDYYYIKSTEYTEVRTLPKVNLTIYDDIDSLERFNNVNNGLLCNQFQFFVKVSIDDFGPDNWGKFEGDLLKDIKLQFNISNNTVDKFTNYNINTIDVLSVCKSQSNYTVDTILLNKDVDIFNVTCKDILRYKKDSTLNNISIGIDDDKEFYIRVLLSFDNPVPTLCHFAYFIEGLMITANNGKYETKLSTKDPLYKSNHLYATIMPISMIAESNTNVEYAYSTVGAVKLYGSKESIKVSISPYLYDYIKIELSNEGRSVYNWSSYKLKNRYFQDNVESIYINPININDIYETLPETSYKSEWLAKDTDDVYNTYLMIAYDTTEYFPVLLEDEEIFYYNNELILNSKYNQVGNNTAVFIELTVLKDIRSKSMLTSLSMWNNEYKALYYKDSDNPYKGHNSVYGNGYLYLPFTADQGQYDANDIISLADIKTAMEKYTFDNNIYTIDINNPYTYDNYTPDKMYCALNHSIHWAYPKYTTDGDNINIINYLDFTTAGNLIDVSKMPYNLAYSIYPRILYNDEELMNIILMLRLPSIKQEGMYSSNRNSKLLVNPLNVLN